MWRNVALTLWSSCLSFWCTRIAGVCRHVWLSRFDIIKNNIMKSHFQTLSCFSYGCIDLLCIDGVFTGVSWELKLSSGVPVKSLLSHTAGEGRSREGSRLIKQHCILELLGWFRWGIAACSRVEMGNGEDWANSECVLKVSQSCWKWSEGQDVREKEPEVTGQFRIRLEKMSCCLCCRHRTRGVLDGGTQKTTEYVSVKFGGEHGWWQKVVSRFIHPHSC